jgi:hypothetical protein
MAYQITTDHVATLPSEKKRIYSSGGEVRRLNNDYVDRIFVRGRIYPALPVSRHKFKKKNSKNKIKIQPLSKNITLIFFLINKTIITNYENFYLKIIFCM